MPSTLTIQGTIAFPLAGEATRPSRPFKAEIIYSQKSVDDVEIEGATDGDVNLMGLITDAKACYLEVVEGAGSLKINGATETLDVSVDGGFWVWFNPNGGLTSLTVGTTDSAKFRVYLFA